MKSIKNIIKIINNIKYISVSINDAIKYQNNGVKLYQLGKGKSLYIKYEDLKADI